MAANKIECFGDVLIDLTGDTVAPETLAKGATAHDKSGKQIVGTMEGGVTPETPTITVSSGGLITASANGLSKTQQLTTQSAKTVTPTKSSQTAVASGRYTTGAVTVDAIPSEYIVPSGSQTLTENKTYDVTNLASVTVGVPTGGVTLEVLTVRPSSASTTFAISGLKGQPKFWALSYSGNLTLGGTRYVISANSNGSSHEVTYAYKSGNNGYVYYSVSYLTATYSNGTLTLKTSSTTNGGNFYAGNYRFVYGY